MEAVKQLNFRKATEDKFKPYSTEDDLLIMAGISHTQAMKRANRKHLPIDQATISNSVLRSYKKIGEVYEEIQQTINALEERINAIIEKEEKEFLSAYKIHLMKLQQELNLYKAKLDDKEYQLKHDILLNSLESSLDFFKKESIRLAEIVSLQKTEIKRIKNEQENLIKENTFLQSQIKKAKKENKVFQLALRKTEQGNNNQTQSEDFPMQKLESTFLNINYQSKFNDFTKCLRVINCTKEQAIASCEKYFKLYSLRHEDIIRGFKLQINHERQIAHKLKLAQSEPLVSRTELEQQFYDCVEQVRRTAINRKRDFQQKANKTMCHMLNKDMRFKTSDKMKVMELFMCNDKLLKKLYGLVFKGDLRLNKTEESLNSQLREDLPDKKKKFCVKDGKLCIRFPEVY